jgi:hypothetical protein
MRPVLGKGKISPKIQGGGLYRLSHRFLHWLPAGVEGGRVCMHACIDAPPPPLGFRFLPTGGLGWEPKSSYWPGSALSSLLCLRNEGESLSYSNEASTSRQNNLESPPRD